MIGLLVLPKLRIDKKYGKDKPWPPIIKLRVAVISNAVPNEMNMQSTRGYLLDFSKHIYAKLMINLKFFGGFSDFGRHI